MMSLPPIDDNDPLWMHDADDDPLWIYDIDKQFGVTNGDDKESSDSVIDTDEDEGYDQLQYVLDGEVEDTRTEEDFFDLYPEPTDDYYDPYEDLDPIERYRLGVGDIDDIDWDDIENDGELLMAWIDEHSPDDSMGLTEEEIKASSVYYREFEERYYLQINGWIWEEGFINDDINPQGEHLNLTIDSASKLIGGYDLSVNIGENINKDDAIALLQKIITLIEVDYEGITKKLAEKKQYDIENNKTQGTTYGDDVPF